MGKRIKSMEYSKKIVIRTRLLPKLNKKRRNPYAKKHTFLLSTTNLYNSNKINKLKEAR